MLYDTYNSIWFYINWLRKSGWLISSFTDTLDGPGVSYDVACAFYIVNEIVSGNSETNKIIRESDNRNDTYYRIAKFVLRYNIRIQ